MKILRVTSDLYPYVVGGVGIHTHEMSTYQVREGHEVTVITLIDKEKDIVPSLTYNIIKIRKLFSLLGNSVSPSFLKTIYEIHSNYDIIHAHSHLFFTTNVCAVLRRLTTTPLIITNHGLISQTAPLWLQRLFIPTIAKWTFKSADKIICYTKHEKNELIDMGIRPEKIAIIHNGINTDIFIPKNNSSKNKKILWIGRYIPGKGVQYLIEAFACILKSHPNTHLLMIGDGPQKEEIGRQIHELGLSANITQKTFVPNGELPSIYQNSDIFVLPSLSEGIPRTILESMACGIPVVCTNLPQLEDLVNGAGLLVPPRDSETIASAVLKILDCPEFASDLGKIGRERIVRDYAWKDTVSKTLTLYKEVICQKLA